MGTNYYLKLKEKVFDNCSTALLNLKPEIMKNFELHIGKSSAGWRFIFEQQTIGSKLINSFEKWKEFFFDDNYEIANEYGEIISPEWLVKRIVEKQCERRHEDIRYHYLSEDGYDFDIGEFS